MSGDLGSLLIVKNLKKTYHNGAMEVPVLKGVDIKVNQGEIHIVFGPSGSGKTTFLNLIGGMDSYDEGNVQFQIDGVYSELGQMNQNQLLLYRRKYIGFVFQFYNLIPIFTTLENVELAAQFSNLDRPHERAKSILERVGLGHRLYQYPGTLSGGEQQRVAIARALVKQPYLLLADEPTGNLDSERSKQITEILREITQESHIAVIIVSHDPEWANEHNVKIHNLKGGILQ